MFKNHLEMIGRNETPSKKAKFWQSYVRSLKGSEDIRAHDAPRTRLYRPLSTFAELPSYRSIYADPVAPAERITVPGYRYNPVHRETYGYSPRPIYNRDYTYRPASTYDPEKAWNDHLERMADIERRYPSRYGLYLKDKPNLALGPLEYEPEDKPGRSTSVPPLRAGSVPIYRAGSPFREMSVPRASSPIRALSPLRALSVDRLDRVLDDLDIPHVYTRALSPTPIKAGRWAPRPSEVAYNYDGFPVTHPRITGLPLRAETALANAVRDPYWWDLGDMAASLRNFRARSLLRY